MYIAATSYAASVKAGLVDQVLVTDVVTYRAGRGPDGGGEEEAGGGEEGVKLPDEEDEVSLVLRQPAPLPCRALQWCWVVCNLCTEE